MAIQGLLSGIFSAIKQLDDNLFQSFIKLTHHGAQLNTLSRL